MMFNLKKGSIAPARWKWPHKTELPLTTKLLRDVPPEIELSDYRKLPSSGPDSPSGLLNDERIDSELIIDLDLFFERLYSYYCQKGLWCIIIKWIVELLYVIFMVGFIAFFLLYVDWDALGKAKCGVEAVGLGEKPCDLPKEVIKQHPLVPFTIGKAIIIGSMVILILYGLLNFLKFFVQLKNIIKIRHFYYNRLNVTDHEIQTTPWPTILEKVVQLQKSQQLCVVKDLSAHDVVMRIMRKQNYLIAMLNKGVLAFSISSWVPGAGPTVKSRITGKKNHLILPKTLEWSLSWCIFQSMFDSKFCLQRDFLTNPTSLRKRLVYLGIGMFLISPCLLIFMLVHLFLRHAEQFYHHPSTASSRRWSNLSKWIFREFNEVDHLFMHRLNNSVVDASNYLKQFPSPLISILAKFVSFVSGGFAAILIIIAFLDESLLEGQIFGRNLFWYAAVFGTVTAISRAVITDELQAHDPEGAMSFVVQNTHYMPKKWRGRENSDAVRAEFETLFQYTGMMLLEEMASIFVTPYLLIFVVPKHVDDILQFISKFTVYVHGVGDVCSFSSFDFQTHGNRKYASPSNAERDKSSQGKMEKSFLSFKSIYPCWEPDTHGHQFLSNLHKFRERQTHLAYSRAVRDNTSDHPWNSMFRWNDKSELTQRFLSREVQQKSQGMSPRHKLDNFLSMNPSQRTHPYILDWYYTTILLDPAIISTDFHPSSKEVIARPSDSMWSLQNKQSSEIEDAAWQSQFSDRLQSHMEASTSRPLFREDYDLQHPVLEPHNMKHWWNRSGPQLSVPQASFMEPPTFGEQHLNFHHGHGSERSEEQAKSDVAAADDEWETPNSMFKTMYNNSDSDDAFDLHFTDEKGKSSFTEPTNHDAMPSVSIPVRIIPSSNDPVWFRGK